MTIKEFPSKVKNHVHRNRGKYGIAVGVIAGLAILANARSQWDEFLDEQGIDHRDFYTPDWRDSTV